MILGFALVALDYPAPFMKNTALHRNFIVRVVALIMQAFMAVLFYQVRIAVFITSYSSDRYAAGHKRRFVFPHCCNGLHAGHGTGRENGRGQEQ